MAKQKKSVHPAPPRRLIQKLTEAETLSAKGRYAEALHILKELEKSYHKSPEVLGELANLYAVMENMHAYEHVLRRLWDAGEHKAAIRYALAEAHMTNLRPALAWKTFLDALRRYPTHPFAEDARQSVTALEKLIRLELGKVELPEVEGFELFAQHDELRYYLAHGEYQRGLQVAEKLLRRYPHYTPIWNNLAQLHAVLGDRPKAIQACLQVLEQEADNIHALSNLARLCFLSGRLSEAQEYAARLKQSPAPAADRWLKIAEALTFLEDDEGVLALYDQVKAAKELESLDLDGGMFYHLLAVSACHLGREKEARQYWNKALAINPHLDYAVENLKDLELPAGERSGAWAFPFQNWFLDQAAKDISALVEKQKKGTKMSEMRKALCSLVEDKHPQLLFLAPRLVRRGDSQSGQFMVRMAAATGHPALLEAARAFVFGMRGTFEDRFEAARILEEAKLLPSGPVRMWHGGEWSEVLLLSMMITDEPEDSSRPRRVQEMYASAMEALYAGDGKRAQELLEEAVQIYPDDPGLLNNLSVAHMMQNHVKVAAQIQDDIHARFPDYFFGIISAATRTASDGDVEKSHTMLNGLMQRKEVHTSEFVALCRAQIHVLLIEEKTEAARLWLDLWEKISPEDEMLAEYLIRIKLLEFTNKGLSWLPGQKDRKRKKSK